MARQKHFDGKSKAGTHTTIITGARIILDTLTTSFPNIRIQNGFIEAGIGARNQSIKIVSTSSMVQMTVITKATKQVFMLYGTLDAKEIANSLEANKKLRGFIINYE
ncbi:MAG: hypothetical protein KBC41_00955 [Candidatus Pacebacteria bacterium]|nr:hypothetical protein [Candidatus Paceibacterota bacterium]MBP9866632.1 hypothetical protein [Candidatus Paceibacterota bacterium]